MSFGGPGSAFSFAAPTRPPRRNNSATGSFRDAAASAANSSSLAAQAHALHQGGPSPVDPPAQPSLGAFSPAHERESLLANGVNGASSPSSLPHATEQQQQPRTFSAILSPGASINGEGGDDVAASGKPFVYSRELLLSLYDEEKAKKRPIELAAHDVATRDLVGASGTSHKPWLLQEYREGEKDLFATSIHPPNTRPSRMTRNDSSLSASGAGTNGASATLDLSSLGTLPRDRDRALASPSLRSPSIEKDILAAGRERRARERSAGAPLGITGGVLGGILGAAGTPTRKKDEPAAAASAEKKEGVWQGGRWRRTAQEAEEAEKQRTSAFGSRRFPLPDDDSRRSSLSTGEAVPESWEEGDDKTPPTGSSALNGDAIPNEPDLAASVLGSLALDDPSDDPLLAKPSAASGAATPSRAAPPPGLGGLPPTEVMWQYRDPSGQVQGPFSATMMHDWYRQQFFTPDLRVKRTTDADFESLENLVRRTGDSEKPFLAPKPSAPASAFSSAPGTPQAASSWGGASTGRAQTPLEQLTAAVAQGRFGGTTPGSSLYEPFGSAAPSPAPEPQTLPQAFAQAPTAALDPWGAPLPSAGGAAGWNPLGGAGLAPPQQQQIFQQLPSPGAPLQSPMDLLRQLAAQQQGGLLGQQQHQQQQHQAFGQQGLPTDVFGRPSMPTSPFFDPSQLAPGAGAASPGAWLGQQLPQQHHLQQQMHQHAQQQQQQPWASLASPLAQFAQAPGAGAPAPIGRPAQVQSPAVQPAQQQQQQQSPWGAVQQQQPQEAPVVEVRETVIVAEPVAPAAPAVVAVVEEVKVAPAPAPAAKQPAVKAASPVVAQKAAPVEQVASPAAAAPEPSPSPAPSSSASKAGASAPWAKEEVAAVAPAAPSPSLREIQEAEAREAAKRKEAARIQAAQANIQAAQRAAALEAQAAAETLPSSASWAAGPAQVPAPKAPTGSAAPWVKPAAVASPVAASKSQKTLKEIQEEEEKRRKALLAAAQQAGQPAAGKGYAGTAQAAAPQVGGAWTTVAVKPAVVAPRAAPGVKPLVPGLPSASTSATAVRAAGASGLPVKPVVAATAAAPRPVAAAVITAAVPARQAAAPRSVNVNGAAAATTVYDMENPPPPSPEFLSWTKQALKGLNVPLDEFIQMLLSFPLDASADVLEIISDSVYANSSTLDGRRFATDFTTRRKNDVAVRYPSIFAKGAVRAAGKPSSMAAVLAATPAPKASEWNVKVSTKKKKGGK
ncbi:kinesin-like protein [Rhodotorula kratochvilovae]